MPALDVYGSIACGIGHLVGRELLQAVGVVSHYGIDQYADIRFSHHDDAGTNDVIEHPHLVVAAVELAKGPNYARSWLDAEVVYEPESEIRLGPAL